MPLNVDLILDEALSRSELGKEELEMELNKLRMEGAGLRDALLKMQALNEGLGQDKVDLNKILMQVAICRAGETRPLACRSEYFNAL